MSERIVADPAEVATGRTELDITPWIKSDGLDWGDAEIAAYMADMGYGSSPVDFRVPNRTIQIPLSLRAQGGTSFATARQNIQAKVARWQQEGGWLKRVTASGTLFCDVVNASLRLSGSWSQANKDYDMDASISVEALPDFYGNEQGDLADDFSTDTITSGQWTFDAGSGTLAVSGGQLVPSSTVEKRLRWTGLSVYDYEVTVKFTTGAAPAGTNFGHMVKWQDSNNYFLVRASGTSINIIKRDDGTFSSTLASTSFTLVATTSYWLRTRIEGNKLTVELFTSAPTSSASTPAASATYTLTGTEITEFGQGAPGGVGLRAVPSDTAERYDDFTLKERVYIERSNAELVATMYGIDGDYPARVRIVVDELEGQSQMGLMWALQSRNCSSADTAQLAYEAEALQPLDTAAKAALGGASGGTVVTHGTLSTSWTPVLNLNLGGTAYLTHVGAYRMFCRYRTTSGTAVALRSVYDVGDLVFPVENDPWYHPVDSAGTAFYVADLGPLTLTRGPAGTHRWAGQVQGRGLVGGENVSLDRIWFQPVDESAGVLRAPVNSDPGLAAYSDRDEFSQTAGNLNAKVSSGGKTWATSGAATDFAVETAGKTLQRTAVSDTGAGRFAASGVAASAAQAVQVDLKTSLVGFSSSSSQGVLARFTDGSNFMRAAVDDGIVQVTHFVAASATDLGSTQVTFDAGVYYTIRLVVDASGRWACWFGPSSGSTLPLVLRGQHSVLATGGTLASGKPGIVDLHLDAAAKTRNYDNFLTWAPTLDEVLNPSQSAELRTDGMVREDTSGSAFGPVSWVEGDLPRLPVSGLESRAVRGMVKASRGDFDSFPDTGIDDIAARVFYRPCWLNVPGT